MKKWMYILPLAALLFAGCSEAEQPPVTTQPHTAAETLPPPPAGPFTVVCLGDSITEGAFELVQTEFGYTYNFDPEEAYPSKLEAMLTADGYAVEVINSGVSGDMVYQGIDRLETDVFAHDPDVVTVCFGLNDVCTGDEAAYEADLNALFDLIGQKLPEAEIIFMTPNMLATYIHEDTAGDFLNYNMAYTNAAVMESGELDLFVETAKAVCARRNIPVCDAYAYWKELYAAGEDITRLLCSYVTHPNREMQTEFARLLTPYVEEALQ